MSDNNISNEIPHLNDKCTCDNCTCTPDKHCGCYKNCKCENCNCTEEKNCGCLHGRCPCDKN